MSERHLFGFLGTGRFDPEAETYTYDRSAYTAPWASDFTSPAVTFVQTASALAIAREGAPDTSALKTTIFATEKARELHREALMREFSEHGLAAPEFVAIPSTFDEASIIALFEALSSRLMGDDARLSFDMTHGFRAQPAIALLVLDYIQAVNPTCRIEHLLYGAYERGLEQIPLVDLIALWQLRDWAAGFREFHRTGSVARLGELVRERRNDFMRTTRGKEGIPASLGNIGGLLESFEEMANINAIPELFGQQGTSGLISKLADAAASPWEALSLDLGRFVRPINEEIERKLAPMRASDWSSTAGLRAQLAWISWLCEHGRYQQALTVAREWATSFVSLLLSARGIDVPRKEADRIFNLLTNPKFLKDATAIDAAIVTLLRAQTGEFAAGCGKLVALRNRLNHAWMPEPEDRDDAKAGNAKPNTVITDVVELFSTELARLETTDTPNKS